MNWTCKYCETKNPDSRTHCEVCGRERESVSSVANEISWICERCETKNSYSQSQCEACGKERKDYIGKSLKTKLAWLVALGALLLGVFLCIASGKIIFHNEPRVSTQPVGVRVNSPSSIPSPIIEPSKSPYPQPVYSQPLYTQTPYVPTQSSWGWNSPTMSPCENSPKRLKVGEWAVVCTWNSHDPVVMRTGPGKGYSRNGHELLTGAEVYVLEGPVCDEDSRWWYWKVRTKIKKYEGWMAEGGDEKDPYFLCPSP